MIKGWRNNPEWVRLHREVERERRQAWIEHKRARAEFEMYEMRRQMEDKLGVYVHAGRDLPAGTIIEVPEDFLPRQKSFWEFWK
jgi:hypothetical protein